MLVNWMRFSFRAGVLVLAVAPLISSTGCSSTKAYNGPVLPDDETSKIYFYSEKGVELSTLSVDGVTQGRFDMGLTVLPGEHTVFAEYKIVVESCNYGICRDEISTGNCQGTVRTKKGEAYALRAVSGGDTASFQITNENSGEFAGHASCVKTGSDSRISPKQWERWNRQDDRPDRW